MGIGDVLVKRSWAAAQSAAGPAAVALASLQGGHGGLVLAWRGNPNSRNLNIGVTQGPYDAFIGGSLKTTVLTDSSDVAPALIGYNGKLWLAWQGTNGAHTVNSAVVNLGGDGSASLSDRAFVNQGRLGNGSTSAPLLASSPYIDWLGVHTLDSAGVAVEAASSPAGSGWQAASPLPFAPDSIGAVADVAIGNGQFLHAWTRRDGRLAFNYSGLDIPFVSQETSPFAPSLALFNGMPYVAWTGSDPNHHLNVAAVAPHDSSIDPVKDKNVITELSLAAPALINVPPGFGGGERLGIVWTGVDGAGTLSAAVIYEILNPPDGPVAR